MTKAYGFKFISNYGDKDDDVWFEGLKDLTRADLDYGFKKMLCTVTAEERQKREAWPPNVKEFRVYCEERFKQFGLLIIEEAFAEVKNNNDFVNPYWSHPLILEAKNRLNKKPDDKVTSKDFQLFAIIYRELCQRFMNGEAISLACNQ